MNKKTIIAVALAAAVCILAAVLIINMGNRGVEDAPAPSEPVVVEEEAELTPEQMLIGTWIQTQEYLDYENEHIHSASVTVTDKERLEFRENGTCDLISPNRENATFLFEYRNGSVILTAEGWAPQLFYFEDGVLIDPETGIARFEKE